MEALLPSPRRPATRAAAGAPSDTLSAAEAARELGVQRRTLYAYVSRGLLPSLPDPGRPRERRYPASAVRRLKAYAAARRDPALGARAAARGSLAWGEPVLESAITRIGPHGHAYRGHDALALAERVGFERVAELLWLGTPALPGRTVWREGAAERQAGAARLVASAEAAGRVAGASDAPMPPIAAAQLALAAAATLAPPEADRRPVALARAGRQVVELVAQLATGAGRPRAGRGAARARAHPTDAPIPPRTVAERLAAAWSPRAAGAAALYDAALVLCADHELNAAAFATRVVASTGGSLHAAVAAGLAALEGSGFGGEMRGVAALLHEAAAVLAPTRSSTADGAADAAALRELVRRRLRRDGRLLGFGHRLYPGGDPRARLLLRLARELGPAPLAPAEALAAAVHAACGEHPRVDYALVALCRAAGAPPHAPLTLFALGRAAGLVAHALEQYELGRVLRPRAQYVGPLPGRERRDAG